MRWYKLGDDDDVVEDEKDFFFNFFPFFIQSGIAWICHPDGGPGEDGGYWGDRRQTGDQAAANVCIASASKCRLPLTLPLSYQIFKTHVLMCFQQ